MAGLLHFFTRKGNRFDKKPKVELLGSSPLFYKVLTIDKKIYKIKRRRWN